MYPNFYGFIILGKRYSVKSKTESEKAPKHQQVVLSFPNCARFRFRQIYIYFETQNNAWLKTFCHKSRTLYLGNFLNHIWIIHSIKSSSYIIRVLSSKHEINAAEWNRILFKKIKSTWSSDHKLYMKEYRSTLACVYSYIKAI